MARGAGQPFPPGERIQHVTIIERVAPMDDVNKTSYRVRYHCCGREGVLSHSTLYSLVKSSHRREHPVAGCRICHPNRRLVDLPEWSPAIPVADLRPIPPSLAPRRALLVAPPRPRPRARAARA